MASRRGAATLALAMCIGLLAPTPRAEAVTAINPAGALARVNADALTAFGSVIDPATAGPFTPYELVAGTLLPVPSAGQLWQVYRHANGTANTAVLVRDEATLAVLGSFVVPDRLRRGTLTTNSGEWMHAVDGASRVFVVGETSIYAIDLTTFAVTTVSAVAMVLPGVGPTFVPPRLAGITYGGPGELYAMYSVWFGPQPTHETALLRRIDLVSGADDVRLIRSCRGFPSMALSDLYAATLYVTGSDLYVPCIGRGVTPLDSPQTVVRLPLASAFDPLGPEFAVTGTATLNAVLVHQASGRLFLLDYGGVLTAFDTATMSFGWSISIGTQHAIGLGLDQGTGEVYFQSTVGFGVLDGMSPTPPVPFVLAGATAQGQERIVPQSGTGHVLALPGYNTTKAASYTIYEILP